MSRGALEFETTRGVVEAEGVGFRKFHDRENEKAGWLFGWGPTVPADGTSTGIDTGGRFFETSPGSGTWYKQVGTMASANFDEWFHVGNDMTETVGMFRPGPLLDFVGTPFGKHLIISPVGVIRRVWATLQTPAGTGVTIDIEVSTDNGSTWNSIFDPAAKLTLDARERTSMTAATQAIIEIGRVTANNLLRATIDSAPVSAMDLTVGAEIVRWS